METVNTCFVRFFLMTFLFFIGFQGGFAQDTLRIISYNIYHGEAPASHRSPNLAQVTQLIRDYRVDIVALQEVDSMTIRSATIYGDPINYVEQISHKVGLEGYFAKAMDFLDGGYGEGLLVNTALEFTTQQLPNPAGGEPRAAAWAKINLQGKDMWISGTHLCHQFSENRVAQVEAILEKASRLATPVIWMGDLNFSPEDPTYQHIPLRWKDAGKEAADESPTYPSSTSAARIDYIWYASDQFELIDYQVLDVPYSDHYPIYVELKLKPR